MKRLKLLSAMATSTAMLFFSIPALAQAGHVPPPPPPPPISTCCPATASFPVTTMFNSVQGNVANSYHLNFTMNPTFNAQMAAYVALLKAMDPSVVAMAMAVNARDGGNLSTPSAGALLQTGAVFWTPPPLPTTTFWPLSAFFTSVADRPVNNWTVVEMTVYVYRVNVGFRQICEVRRFAFRPQIIGARLQRGSPPSGFIDYQGPAPREAPPPPAPPPVASPPR